MNRIDDAEPIEELASAVWDVRERRRASYPGGFPCLWDSPLPEKRKEEARQMVRDVLAALRQLGRRPTDAQVDEAKAIARAKGWLDDAGFAWEDLPSADDVRGILKQTTPPEIVGRDGSPGSALAAFVGQELERWGFTVDVNEDHVHVNADGRLLSVAITEGECQ